MLAIVIIANAAVTSLYADGANAIRGVEITRPDGTRHAMGCQALVLACNGYGGAPISSRGTSRKCVAPCISAIPAIAGTR